MEFDDIKGSRYTLSVIIKHIIFTVHVTTTSTNGKADSAIELRIALYAPERRVFLTPFASIFIPSGGAGLLLRDEIRRIFFDVFYIPPYVSHGVGHHFGGHV